MSNFNVRTLSHTSLVIITDLYAKSTKINKLAHIKANSDGNKIIDLVSTNKWKNYKKLICIAKNSGKVSKHALFFPGDNDQRLVLDRNIVYGLKEFTITTWVKPAEYMKPTTILEIVPTELLDLERGDLDSSQDKNIYQEVVNDYSKATQSNSNSINVELYNTETQENSGSSVSLNSIKGYKPLDWNYLTMTYKDNKFYMFVNGELINYTDNSNSSREDELSKLSKDMKTVIGASFLDDITDNKARSMYIDDLIIYDKAIFTKDFEVPEKNLDFNNSNIGIKFKCKENVIQNVKTSTKTYLLNKIITSTRTRRLLRKFNNIVVLKY